MARKKTVVKRKPLKIKKTRKISEEHKEKLRDRLAEMRAKKKPAEYKNIAKSVLALPDDDTYSFKNVKEWIKENKLLVSALGQQARSTKIPPKEKQAASTLGDSKKAYIRYCEFYLKTGDWIGMFSGANEEHKIVPRVVAMAYNSDGTPKRTVGFWYPDIETVWTKEMESGDVVVDMMQSKRDYYKKHQHRNKWEAITDKQFTANL